MWKMSRYVTIDVREGGPLQNQTEKSMINQLKEAQISVFTRNISNNSVAINAQKSPKRQLKRKKEASYRKVKTYYKSIEQYKKERNRRKQAWLLSGKGLTHAQIAKRLGVSEKTVYRDMQKIGPYYFRKMRHEFEKWQMERWVEEQKQLESMTLAQQVDFVCKRADQFRKAMRGSEYRGHYTIFYLDMTQPDEYGIPKLTQLPHQTRGQPLTYPYKIRVVVKGRYEGRTFEAEIGGFNIIQTTRW